MKEVKNRLSALRQALKSLGANAFYGALSDAHLSEYIQKHDQFVTFLTGFTGSNAQILVTETEAFLWTDSRYWEQADSELSGSGITLMRDGSDSVPKLTDWLKEKNSQSLLTLAVPLESLPLKRYLEFKECVSRVIDFPDKTIESVWTERPEKTVNSLYIHRASSVSAGDKLKRLQDWISQNTAEKSALLLTKLDDIAWITNLRGSDIEFNPVFLSWALVTENEARLFLHQAIITEAIKEHLKTAGWQIAEYTDLDQVLTGLRDTGVKLLAREDDLNAKLYSLAENDWQLIKHPVALWKSIKTPEEIAGLREVMKADGKAIENFIEELKARLAKGEHLTENDAAAILHEKRAAIPGFIRESFGTIAAVDANAALPHYEPKEGKGALIVPPCVLLVDSGAHYDKGTTDTTRVWFLGNSQDFPEEKLNALKRDYTAVYRAMKALSEVTFKPGTTGFDLDKIARAPIHAIGADFGHGTGHGIGLTLNVHETPPTISPREYEGSLTAFQPGMIVSDEPGIYRPGLWGIRIENMLCCVEKEDGLLGFETLTKCAIDKTLLED